MRIAFIILCHKDARQINRLIDKLMEFRDADIYIHVDLNSDDIREQISVGENIHIIPEQDSFRIKWGSVDIVRATLQLVRYVKKTGCKYDYIWLMSGQDYPICSIDSIEKKLQNSQGTNYIETIVPGDNKYNRYKKLYEIAYPKWINQNSCFVKMIKRMYMIITGGFRYTFPVFVRKKPFDFDFVFGSQWWTLTADAAYDILEYSDSHHELLKYYEKCIIPDESFFQTIFMRGPYSKNTAGNLTYVNWGKDRRSPEILTEADFDMIKKKAEYFCFARKFDSVNSSTLMDLLDC